MFPPQGPSSVHDHSKCPPIWQKVSRKPFARCCPERGALISCHCPEWGPSNAPHPLYLPHLNIQIRLKKDILGILQTFDYNHIALCLKHGNQGCPKWQKSNNILCDLFCSIFSISFVDDASKYFLGDICHEMTHLFANK